MPSRKSNVSTTTNGLEEGAESGPTAPTKGKKEQDGLSVDDLTLPKSMVARLSKGVLPANTQIHKDALLALHKSATVFVSYIASNSHDNAQASGKKTINPQDVMAALKDAELAHFLPRLEAELKKYNDVQCDKRNTYRRKVKEEKAAAAVPEGEAGEGDSAAKDGEPSNGNATDAAYVSDMDVAEPAVKKLKGENGAVVVPDAADDAEHDEEDDDQDPDEQDEDGEEDQEAEDEGANKGSDGEDQTMEDALEEQDDEIGPGGMRDEALDDPDSD